MEVGGNSKSLPESAYRKLKPGETYVPVVPADTIVPELTPFSLIWGLAFAVLFSAASAYLGLKIGQVFEAAIPITIMAIALSKGKKGALQQNVMIQSIGSASGVVVAGAIFTLPGIYILELGDKTNFLQMCLASLLGGFLGILLLIPFRRYFVKDMHGEFPFPEATASTEVLMAGEAGGNQAGLLLSSGLIAGVYQFLSQTLGGWRETFSTTAFGWGRSLSLNLRLEFNLMTEAAIVGLGYIIGLRYALIIACGSFLSWYVMTPMIGLLGKGVPVGDKVYKVDGLATMATGDIFYDFVRPVGIGAIAMAGMIGVWKSREIIVGAIKLASQAGKQGGEVEIERTQQDMPMSFVTSGLILTLLAVFCFFLFLVPNVSLTQAIVGLVVVAVISFLFTTVAARAIAIVGTNPVSGMTLMTLIISSVILKWAGMEGPDGIVSALLIGGVVCTALSMSGGFISDLKIGYWLGTTPKVQQKWKFLGTIVAAVSVTAVIMMLAQTPGFDKGSGLAAPQANAMASLIEPLMTGQEAPWLLYMAGMFMALILDWVGIPALAFALGMYLPLEINTPVLAGGAIAHFVTQGGTDEQKSKRKDKGTLMASGFVAGGAIMGVIGSTIRYIGSLVTDNNEWSLEHDVLHMSNWLENNPLSAVVTLVAFCILGYILYRGARSADTD
ncbi:MAG: oligopeptide transporter, OPT family [bacterium]|nr:oligopeptide transporter, OPT family [bacterium]